MIEVHIEKEKNAWSLKATILPHAGLGIAQDATLVSLAEPSFAKAAQAIQPLIGITFSENRDRWPVPEPKFQITNLGSHPEHEKFGNYKIERNGEIIGNINNFPKTEAIDLIKEALNIVAEAEVKS